MSLTICTSIFTLCYFVELSNVLTPKINIGINIRHLEANINDLNIYPGTFQSNSTSNRKGFILVSRYYEQQIGAAMNLLTLSKWAKTVGAFPVEPFVSKSEFYNYVSGGKLKNPLYFHDYFDIELWNKMCLNVSAMPLISWSTFMADNPGKFILVIDVGQETSKQAFINEEIMNEVACKESFLNYETKLQYYITHTLGANMNVIRRVCISFKKRHPINISSFTDIIYGDIEPNDAVVWFQLWRGIMRNMRVRIIEPEYARSLETIKMLQTSKRIIDDSKKYVRNILQSDFGKYVAISFRTFKRAKRFFKKEKKSSMEFFHSCISQLHETVSLINGTNNFLAHDLGRFGDNKLIKDSEYITDDMIATIEHQLFQSVYNGKLTMHEWERQFIKVTGGITDSGYIAAMHSELLKNSGCIVMFGGDSNFQRSVLYRYKQLHLNNDSCIHEVCYIQ